jgi:predicted transcriptional regulator
MAMVAKLAMSRYRHKGHTYYRLPMQGIELDTGMGDDSI